MATNYPINPRVRAYGKARLDIAQRARSPADWQRMWVPPAQGFPFKWGQLWKQCIEYSVDDFAAEVGFYIDVLGLPVNALDPDYAMFTSPGGDFYFAVVPARGSRVSTPPDSIRLQFMLADILATAEELEARGIVFESPPVPCQEGSNLFIGCFRSPHGIPIELWGMVGTEDRLQISFDFESTLETEDHYMDDESAVNDKPQDTIMDTEEAVADVFEISDDATKEKDDIRYEDIEESLDGDESDYDYNNLGN